MAGCFWGSHIIDVIFMVMLRKHYYRSCQGSYEIRPHYFNVFEKHAGERILDSLWSLDREKSQGVARSYGIGSLK